MRTSAVPGVLRRRHNDCWSRPGRPTAVHPSAAVDAAEALEDLRVPPGNRLEKLKRYRAGQYSIRINDQWRICFRWTG